LLVVRQTMAARLNDLQTCEGLLINGNRELQTNEQIREAINSQRARITEIDQALILNGQ
jgi:hypothetical protein